MWAISSTHLLGSGVQLPVLLRNCFFVRLFLGCQLTFEVSNSGGKIDNFRSLGLDLRLGFCLSSARCRKLGLQSNKLIQLG